MATDINTLARKCGVSKATISRVFTGRARVSEAIRARVLAAARELNYRPQQVMARDCVAIVVSRAPSQKTRGAFSERLIPSTIFEITRRNLLTEIIAVGDLPKLYDGYTKAVLLLLPEETIAEHRAEIEKLSMPIITVNKRYPFSISVNTDHGQGVTLALKHLYENGHRRIGIAIDRLGNQAGLERSNAYTAFMNERQLPPLEIAEFRDPGNSGQLDRLLAEKPTALVVCGEGAALPALCAIRKHGIRIPEELSVITSELAEVSGLWNPGITTIDQDLDLLAAELIDCVNKCLRNPELRPEARWLPSRLILRESVRNIG